MPPQSLSVTVFDGVYYSPPQLAADGYHLINSNTAALSLNEPTATAELAYAWHPYLFGDLAYANYSSWWEITSDAGRAMVDGAQVCMWGTPAPAMLSAMRARAPAVSDRSWHPQAMRSFVDFKKRWNGTDGKLAAMLDAQA